jgi:hypothetical protein
MGNDFSSYATNKADRDDNEYLKLQLSSIFNEQFASSVFDTLPAFNSIKNTENGSFELDLINEDYVHCDEHFHNFAKLLCSKFNGDNVTSLDEKSDFRCTTPSTGKKNTSSAFLGTDIKRMRLMLRVFKVSYS